MTSRISRKALFVGFLGCLVVLSLASRRSAHSSRLPSTALRSVVSPTPSDLEVVARQRIVIEPLPNPGVTVRLKNINTNETGTFEVGKDGAARPAQARDLAYFFRCRRTGRQMPIAPGVLVLLADVAQHWPTRVIEVVSGFRAPPYGAAHSKHFRGHAIDLRVRGVRTAKVRDYLWRGHHQVGVGHYPGENFVHMDWRPGEPDTAWTAADEAGTPEYHPRWAKKARHIRRSDPGQFSPALAAASPSVRAI